MSTHHTKTALITGALQSVGMELACLYAQQGGNLILVDRSGIRLKALKHRLEKNSAAKVMVISEDLSDREAPTRIYSLVKSRNIAVDCLINITDFQGRRNWSTYSLPVEQQHIMQVNIVALTELTNLFLQDMVSRNRGKILNISTEKPCLPEPLRVLYYAIKSYLSSFTQVITDNYEANNIVATELCSDFINTPFSTNDPFIQLNDFKNTRDQDSLSATDYKNLLIIFLGSWSHAEL